MGTGTTPKQGPSPRPMAWKPLVSPHLFNFTSAAACELSRMVLDEFLEVTFRTHHSQRKLGGFLKESAAGQSE